jgi:hypothetical protein
MFVEGLIEGLMMPFAALLGLLAFRWPHLRFRLSHHLRPGMARRRQLTFIPSLIIGATVTAIFMVSSVVSLVDALLLAL